VTNTIARTFCKAAGVAAATVILCATGAAPVAAQADPNPGAVSVAAGLDAPSVYFFRGIRQESEPELTLWPFADLGLALYSGDGGLKSVGVNIGVWNSLHTGTSGATRSHYEEDFYTTLSLGFGGGVTLGTTYMALTSPNSMFTTVKELQFKLAKAHLVAPYVFLARELGAGPGVGQADAGSKGGTYLELGVGPSWALGGGKATLAVPVKVGLSLSNYYEMLDVDGVYTDDKFGFFDVGALVTVPLTGIPSSFGSWNIHGGVDVLVFGDTTKSFNTGDTSKVVGVFGLGFSY
jgi:hypothetical protein